MRRTSSTASATSWTCRWTRAGCACRGRPGPVAADVALITPLRDGMNLVAKEYVACHPRGDGVLILSEFAGAARELSEALPVNPYDAEAIARQVDVALAMAPEERRGRMRALGA